MPHEYEKVQVDNTIEVKFSILKHELRPHGENFNGTVVLNHIFWTEEFTKLDTVDVLREFRMVV